MEVQAALGSDIALAFDECTPFHVERDYTARSMERTHRWLDRCVAWCREHAPERPAPLRDRAGRRARGPARRVDRLRGRRRRRRDRDRRLARARRRSRCARWSAGRSPACRTSRRATCSASATWTTSSTPWAPASTPSTARRPPGSPATAPRSCTTRSGAGGSTSTKSAHRDQPRADRRRTAPAPPAASTRAATCTTCSRAGELTAKRLLTLHNLTFMERLMSGLREAIARRASYAPRGRAGAQRECSPMKSRSPSICC